MVITGKQETMEIANSDTLFEELYESTFPGVAKFVSMKGGGFDDAKDIFHDALIIYYEKTREENVVARVSPQHYILGIARHLWIRKFNSDKHHVVLDDMENSISIPDDYFIKPDDNRLLSVLEFGGRKCMDLLQRFYYDKLPLKTITKVLGYSTIRSATVQKFKCLEKIRNKVREKSILYEDFIE